MEEVEVAGLPCAREMQVPVVRKRNRGMNRNRKQRASILVRKVRAQKAINANFLIIAMELLLLRDHRPKL